MGWTAPRTASSVPRWSSLKAPSGREPSVGKSIIDASSVTRVGLDLAKRVFRIHAVDAAGSVVIARSVNRRTLLKLFDALPRGVVAMEACSSAHHWGRQLLALGFAVRLIPPAHVKPYVRRNKNDAADAAAISRGGRASGPALRSRALGGEPGGADAPSRARAHGRATHGGAQRPARPSVRDRRGGRARGAECLRPQAAGVRRLRRQRRDRRSRLRSARARSSRPADRWARRGDRGDRQGA